MALTARFDLTGYSRFTSLTDLSTSKDDIVLGSSAGNQTFDSIMAEIESGTGSGQANSHWADERSILTGANDDLDLAGGLTNAFGATITFTAVKVFLMDIDAPDGTKVLRVGPQAVASAWTAWFGGTGATVYETVYQSLYRINEYGGWGTITAGSADVLRINNPGAGTVTYRILIVGVA